MAPPGTILTGQIQQTTGTTQAVVPQVVTQSGQSMQQQQQQLQQITVAAAQQQPQQPQTQQVPLPPAVPPVPEKEEAPSLSQEGLLQTPISTAHTPVTTTAPEVPKETAVVEGGQVHPDTKEAAPLVTQDPTKPSPGSGVDSPCAQPTPGTVPSQPVSATSSEIGLPVATTAEEVKERCPPKAMVKPQVSKVLTHVIEDFVIQESSEPFPVTRSGMISDLKPIHSTNDKDDEPPRKKQALSLNALSPKGDMMQCEACGVMEHKSKFKKNKRFCSVACSKSGKCKDDKKKWDKSDDMDSEDIKAESTSPSLHMDDDTPKVDPTKWTVQEVIDFIKNLPGCSDYADDFLLQEIDGQALMLLKEDHLMTAMGMKLGPALKIVAKIDEMRIDKEPPKQP